MLVETGGPLHVVYQKGSWTSEGAIFVVQYTIMRRVYSIQVAGWSECLIASARLSHDQWRKSLANHPDSGGPT